MTSYFQLILLHLFILLLLPTRTFSAQGCDIRCKCSQNKMTCHKYMPFKLPGGIKMLTVEGNADETKLDEFWTDKSWQRLESLTLNNYTSYTFNLNLYKFGYLNRLSYFGLHSTNFDQLENAHLKAIPSLKELNLSGSTKLTFRTIISALSGGNLPNLEALNLDYVASDTAYTSMNRLDNSFVNVLLGKPLTKLIITNTMIEINFTALFKLETLQFVNFSGPWISLKNFKLPQGVCENNCLKTLDLSGSAISVFKTKADFISQNIYDDSCVTTFVKMLLARKNLYLNSILDMKVSLINVTYNLKKCPDTNVVKANIKTLHLRKNGLKKLDLHFVVNTDVGLEYLDLSDNILEYISPDFFKIFGSLSSLDLSSNHLNRMEENQQFSMLFKQLTKLKFLRLSANQISFIPDGIFTNNKMLVILDLSHNKISKGDFTIQQFNQLRILNLAGNRIKFIEMGFLQQLDQLSIQPIFKTPNISETNKKVIVLHDNQFYCSCASVAFLNWLMSKCNRTESKSMPTCILEKTFTTLDQGVVEKSKYLCIKKTVTILAYTLSVLLVLAVVGILLVLIVRRRRRIKESKVNRLIEALRQETVSRYLIFFSYCGEDESLAMQHILPKLSETLSTRVGCDQDLICVGDLKFRPGFPIHEEMVKCISESFVAVMLVSNAFCESRWCETEVQEAVTQNKPVVLFLVDHVDEDKMSPYLQTLFHRYTRVVVTTTDNNVELKPDLNTICQSFLELAIDYQKYGGFYEILYKARRSVCCEMSN